MKNSKNPKIVRFPMSVTEEDLSHCSNCIDMVENFLDPSTDGESLSVTSSDIVYLARLLCREYQIMREVIKSTEGSDDVV